MPLALVSGHAFVFPAHESPAFIYDLISALSDSSSGAVVERYTYDVFGKRTILAPDGSTTRAASKFDNPYGYTSRREDKESGLMNSRARYFDPTVGEFASQDPTGYVDGMSLFRGYFLPSGVDPDGCKWHWIGGNYWQASENGDSLSQLATTVSHNEQDWRCIWPVPAWRDADTYPLASKCDVADVSNLNARVGPRVFMTMDNEGLGASFIKERRGAQHVPTGDLVYTHLRSVSKEGETPIYYMEFMAHNDGRSTAWESPFAKEQIAGFDVKRYRPNTPTPRYFRSSNNADHAAVGSQKTPVLT